MGVSCCCRAGLVCSDARGQLSYLIDPADAPILTIIHHTTNSRPLRNAGDRLEGGTGHIDSSSSANDACDRLDPTNLGPSDESGRGTCRKDPSALALAPSSATHWDRQSR